ncbi:MAG: hypothetical protein AB7K24_04290 [Gemmataceae bacterium]
MHSILCCTLLGTIIPEFEPAAKYWLEIQVIEIENSKAKDVGSYRTSTSFKIPKEAKILATHWHPIDARRPVSGSDGPHRLRSTVQFRRYGVESHHFEYTLEYITGQGRDQFTHEANASVDLEPGNCHAFGCLEFGRPNGSNWKRLFTVTLHRVK